MLNRIVLIGRLVRDPELRYTDSGVPVTNFTLAVERNYKNRQGERDVDFIKIVTWRKLAETCVKYLSKGKMVAVEGRLQIRKNENNGRTYINPEVYTDSVQFLDYADNKRNNSQNNNKQNPQGQGQRKNNQNNYNQNKGQNQGQQDGYYDEDFDVPF